MRVEDNLDAFPVPAFVVDLDGMVIAWNQAAIDLFGVGDGAVIGRKLADLDLVDPMSALVRQVQHVLSTRAPETISDVRVPRRSETVRITGSVLTDDQARVAGCLVAAEDLGVAHGLRDATEELRGARHVERSKDTFLAMLAHELRNPLAPLLSAAYVVGRVAATNATLRAAHRVIARQVNHLARLVDDLLDVARIRQGRIDLRRIPVSLTEAAREAAETVNHRIRSGCLQFSTAFPPEPIVVNADRVRLVQIIGNLLDNAAKYTGPSGRIEMTGAVEGGMAVLRVKDTGIGIDPEMLPRVFDLFVQAESSLDRAGGGLGIGLTLVRNMVELHGGTVSAHSEGLGLGSLFVVRLPLSPTSAVENPPPATTEAPGAAARRRILIVEDNRDTREMLRTALELEGQLVTTAMDGPSAVRQVRAAAPDIVLLDLGLPGMDGFETAREIRRLVGDSVLLVALTGYGDADSHRRAVDAGFHLHVLKPVDPEDLLRLLARHRRPAPR